jgi:hypothetical protein
MDATRPARRSRPALPRAALATALLLCPALATGARPAAPTAADRIVGIIERIESGLVETEYRHVTRVKAREGRYFFDCSGMAEWILRRGAPQAMKSIGKPDGRRPLAVHFHRRIARIRPGEQRGPWMRVRTAAHARPGDVIAWVRPKWFDSTSTGHVAFVVGEPALSHGPVPGILVRVADSSKFKHEDDSRDEATTGFGTGVLLIPTDEALQPTGYGWFGSRTRPEWVVPTDLVIGRPLR